MNRPISLAALEGTLLGATWTAGGTIVLATTAPSGLATVSSDVGPVTVITSVVNVLTTLIAIATIDRYGRKPLLLIGSAGMAVTLGVLAILFGTAPVNATVQPVLSGAAGPIALVAANLYVVAFGMSLAWSGMTVPPRH